MVSESLFKELKFHVSLRCIYYGMMLLAATGLFLAATPDVYADSNKKFHFTQTLVSSPSPGIGHEGHQLAWVLAPNKGTIYDGSMTYTASAGVAIVVLHEIDGEDVRGQPTWTVDGETIYGWTLVAPDARAGSFEYTGAALAFHTTGEEFVVTASVDGWIRGEPTEISLDNPVRPVVEPYVSLARASVPATIPMHAGLYDGERLLYILTDASDSEWAATMSQMQEWRVEVAPPLADAPDETLNTMYVFTNGISGDGLYGYQDEVFMYTPDQEEYNALSKMVEVTWRPGQTQAPLEFASDVQDAIDAGRITMEYARIVVNAPQIVWPGGQMQVRDSPEITNDMAYGGGQITDIDENDMTVTFVAHRGWGPDGSTIYYIVTDAVPSDPAKMMGVVNAPAISSLITNPAAVDLFQFSNGLKSTGPLGFQPGIAAAAPGDEMYSPMWRIFIVEWNDPADAVLLETRADIDYYRGEEMLTTNIARPMNSDHIVNCPFIDPFQ